MWVGEEEYLHIQGQGQILEFSCGDTVLLLKQPAKVHEVHEVALGET